jgi:peptidoglycan/LPS O-acetylase OafA/YrhL
MPHAHEAAAPPRLPYMPGLDGLRAIAVLMVLAYHARAPFAPGGFIGVDLFFVLSGFLITRLLQRERETNSRIAILAFYWRRARRLYPALLFMLLVYLALAPLLWPELAHLRDAALAASYVANWSIVLIQAPVVLSHTWSLAIEEQFYLAWPLLVSLLPRRRALPLLVALFLLASGWRAYCLANEVPAWAVYVRLDTRASGLVLGAVLALLDLRLQRPRLWSSLGLLALLALDLWARWLDPDYLRYGISLTELVAAVLILAASTQPGWLGHPWMAWLGRLSYGIYLWHYPLMRAVRDDWPWWLTLLVGGAASVFCAWLSYQTVERWSRVHRAGQ